MNAKIIIITVVVLAAIIALFSYFSRQYYTAPAEQGNANAPKEGNAVEIINFTFNPSVLKVKTGTTVTWTNSDTVPHTIKSGQFNSENLSAGKSFEYKYENTGTYDYSCGLHPSMNGQIIVE